MKRGEKSERDREREREMKREREKKLETRWALDRGSLAGLERR